MPGFKTWLRTSPVALFITVVPLMAMSLFAAYLMSSMTFEASRLEAGYFKFWRRDLPYLALVMFIMAPLYGLLECRLRKSLTLETCWSSAGGLYRFAFFLMGILWLERAVREHLPRFHARWATVLQEPLRFVQLHMVWISVMVMLLCFAIFFVPPFVQAYRKK